MKLTWLTYTATAAMAALTAFSCSDVVNIDEGWDPDNVSTGAPSIRKITASADTSTVISTAALNQSIAIFGDNLTDLESVTINDLNLDLTQVYAKRHRLELVVPRKLPGEVTNTLRIVTKRGEVSAQLNVVLPQLVINGFKNDFAADRDTVQVVGSDFDLYMIDSINAKLTFNGQAIKMIGCDSKSFGVEIPAGTPTDAVSYLTIETPELAAPIQIPFREPGIPILTNDNRTWQGGWWPTGIQDTSKTEEIINNDRPEAPGGLENPLFRWYVYIKKNFPGTWGYENVMITHFWLDNSATDLLANPDNWCVKMEINNPSGTPLARYLRLGASESEGAGKFYMWDPASSNNGVALNTMGAWQTVQFEVTDLFPSLEDGKKTCLKIAADPYNNTDQWNNFKVAMQRETAGDVELYFWNLRFVKKIATN